MKKQWHQICPRVFVVPLQLSKGGDLDAVQALLDRKVPDLLPLSLDPQGKINAETSGTDMSNPLSFQLYVDIQFIFIIQQS